MVMVVVPVITKRRGAGIAGEIEWCDSRLVAALSGTLFVDSQRVEFSVGRLTGRDRHCELDRSGAPSMQWLASATFKGTVSGSKLSGSWEAVRLHRPAPPFPRERLAFSDDRRTPNVEVLAGGRTLRISGRDSDRWGAAVVHHSRLGGRPPDSRSTSPSSAALTNGASPSSSSSSSSSSSGSASEGDAGASPPLLSC